MDFSQIWYPWKDIFEENPMPYVTKDEDHYLWKTSEITEIAPLRSFWRFLEYITSGFLLSGCLLLQLDTDLGEVWVILGQKYDFH